MQTPNIIQYAPIFDAAGIKINIHTDTLSASVVDCPKKIKATVTDAVSDISKYMDTQVYADGIAAFAIAHYIDDEPNPMSKTSRENILAALGLTKNGQYISQVLALLKTNKSWHLSDIASNCSHFGDICTHRGITNVPGKRGRKSNRSPEDYHLRKTNGTIDREQLVTPAVESLYRLIPSEQLVSQTKQRSIIRLDDLDNMSSDELADILERVKMAESRRS